MYAIIKTGGKQYTVKPGDVIDVEKIEGAAGDKVQFEVLFLNDGSQIVTDAEALANVTVTGQIVDQHKGKKAVIFKFKKRKGYKRTKGHRQQLTKVAIVDVNGETAEAPAPKAAPVVEEPAVEAEPVVEAVETEAAEAKDFASMTVAELKAYAKENDIKVPSGARKAEIVEMLQNA